MGAPFDYRSKADMRELANLLRHAPEQFHDILCAGILANDLMRCQWFLRLIVRLRAGRDIVQRYALWLSLIRKMPEPFAHLIEATAQHIENGRDHVDPASVGGFNADEVSALWGMITAIIDAPRPSVDGGEG